MAYLDDYNLAQDEEFRKKVKVGMLKIAAAVSGEASSPTESMTNKRNNTATHVIYNQSAGVEMISNLIASLGTLDSNSTDQQIYDAISSVWNDLSGVKFVETQAPA